MGTFGWTNGLRAVAAVRLRWTHPRRDDGDRREATRNGHEPGEMAVIVCRKRALMPMGVFCRSTLASLGRMRRFTHHLIETAVLPVVRHRGPGTLERKQADQQDENQTAHNAAP